MKSRQNFEDASSSEDASLDSNRFYFLKENYGAILRTKYENLYTDYEELVEEWNKLYMYY